MIDFWRTKQLEEMSDEEWESLCDGCALCCLHKLEDVETGEVHYTNVVCRFMTDDCRCSRYPERHQLVPDCVELTAADARSFSWLPASCAYRLLAEGQELKEWHPLVSGRAESVHEAGISVRGRVISETHVHPDELETHIVRWVDR